MAHIKLFSILIVLAVLTCEAKKHGKKTTNPHKGKNQDIKVSIHRSNRIFSGEDAPAGKYPHQVSLRPTFDHNFHFCGGSIVSECHVVTASHCDSCKDAGCVVAMGSTKVKQMTVHDIESYTQHEDYVMELNEEETYIKTIRNDIAFIKLAQGHYAEFDDNTKAIDIATDALSVGTKTIITGFGYLDKENTLPQDLQMTTVKVIECPANQKSWYNFICISSDDSGACAGDSGGPMVHGEKLVGVASYASDCEKTPSFDGYTNVSSYADWIRAKMEEMPC